MNRVPTLVLAVIVLWQSATALAQESVGSAPQSAAESDSAAQAVVESRLSGQSPDDVIGKLDRLEQPRDAKVTSTPLDQLLENWEAAKEHLGTKTGLSLGVSYTTLYQRLTNERNGNEFTREGAAGDLDIFGNWSMPGAERNWSIGFQAEMRHRIFTGEPPSGLGQSAGSLWGTTTGFNTQDLYMIQYWWHQALFDDAIIYRIGKLDYADYFDVGTLNSANLYFSNNILSDNPAIGFPDNGPGAAVHLSPGKNWHLNLGIGDANARKTDESASFFNDRDYFTAMEFGLTPDIAGYGQGFYQVTLWDTDGNRARNSNDTSGRGVAVRFEQFIGEEFMVYTTYARSTGRARATRQLATAGFGLLDILGYKDDLIGVAMGWGQPRDRSLRDQYVAELFYRIQITDYLQLTPDIQVIVDPSQNRNDDIIGVLGLRLRLDF